MDVKIKCKTIKLMEKKPGKIFQGPGPGKEFSNLTPEVWPIKGKSDKSDVKKLKTFTLQKNLEGNELISYRVGENIGKLHI